MNCRPPHFLTPSSSRERKKKKKPLYCYDYFFSSSRSPSPSEWPMLKMLIWLRILAFSILCEMVSLHSGLAHHRRRTTRAPRSRTYDDSAQMDLFKSHGEKIIDQGSRQFDFWAIQCIGSRWKTCAQFKWELCFCYSVDSGCGWTPASSDPMSWAHSIENRWTASGDVFPSDIFIWLND